MAKRESEIAKLKAEIAKLKADGARLQGEVAKVNKRTAKVAPPLKKRYDEKWLTQFKVCPHCGLSKVVWRGVNKEIEDFGVRRMPQGETPQPWCRKCRSTTSKEYYAKVNTDWRSAASR